MASVAAAPYFARAAKHTFGIQGDRFVLDGKPFVIRSGEMHYARIPREYWRDRMKKMRAMGLNTLCMYSFWNMHEPVKGQFDFSGNLDIATFITTAQEEGLWVIVRPGPYSCAEWEFGGFPWWLLQTPDMKVRTTDPRFLEAAGTYIKRLLAEVAPLQITHGGPVIMMQVENEYGSFGSDKQYLGEIRKMILDSGIDITLYTSDGSEEKMLAGGTLPDLPSVVNFGGPPEPEFANFAKFRQGVPLMCGEYWVGWFDHWGEKHHTGDNRVHLAGIDWMLSRNISFNLYMVHGGTSFGFMAGANYATVGKGYEPTITSYDYDSPIDEAGRLAPKFKLYRDVIAKHLGPDEKLPEPPSTSNMIDIPRFDLTESMRMFDVAKEGVESDHPKTFEELGQGNGFVLYRTPARVPGTARLKLGDLRDYAIIYEGFDRLGVLDRRFNQTTIDLPLKGDAPLAILVENMGRINYGPRLLDDNKGIIGPVTINGQPVKHWTTYALPMSSTAKWQFVKEKLIAPAFFRGKFKVSQPGDTYFDMTGWGKGLVWVNGHNLGRHWKVGPQRSLYCPGVWLKHGRNEIIVLDLEDSGKRSIEARKDPIWRNDA
jgi:beta-galactosidase